jgi:hypothetical protein
MLATTSSRPPQPWISDRSGQAPRRGDGAGGGTADRRAKPLRRWSPPVSARDLPPKLPCTLRRLRLAVISGGVEAARTGALFPLTVAHALAVSAVCAFLVRACTLNRPPTFASDSTQKLHARRDRAQGRGRDHRSHTSFHSRDGPATKRPRGPENRRGGQPPLVLHRHARGCRYARSQANVDAGTRALELPRSHVAAASGLGAVLAKHALGARSCSSHPSL